METLFYNISQVLGITIIHSLWQGLLVYMLLRFLLQCLPALSSNARYSLSCMALLAITVWFIYTLLTQAYAYNWHPAKLTALAFPINLNYFKAPKTEVLIDRRYYFTLAQYLPYLTCIYLLGVSFHTARFAWALLKIRKVKQTLIATGFQEQVNNFARLFKITKNVQVKFSEWIDVPCIIGYFKPLILLPVSLATSLSADEITAIVLHELAHIRRNDYLFNILQQVISIVLFFNPFNYLVTRLINGERENCCDDIVIRTTRKPLIYAQALLKIEESRQQEWQLALAATGKKYHLLTRIERIMKTKKSIGNVRPILFAILLLAGGLSSIAWLNPKIANGKISVKAVSNPLKMMLATDTVKKNKVQPAKHLVKTKASKSNVTYTTDLTDAQLEQLQAAAEKYGREIQKYYESPEFKQQLELLQEKSKAIAEYYNRPDMKKMRDEQEKLALTYAAISPDMKGFEKQMQESSRKIGEYYSSKEFTDILAEMEKKYNIPHNHYYGKGNAADSSVKYKEFQDAVNARIPNDVKQQTEVMKQLGKKMKDKYDSPEFRERTKRMTALGDSIKLAYNSTDIKAQQTEMSQLSKQIAAYQNKPEIKKAMEQLKEVQKQIDLYLKSADYQKMIKESVKTEVDEQMIREDIDKKVKLEKAEKVEKTEKPEKKEKPEQQEKPEKQEKP